MASMFRHPDDVTSSSESHPSDALNESHVSGSEADQNSTPSSKLPGNTGVTHQNEPHDYVSRLSLNQSVALARVPSQTSVAPPIATPEQHQMLLLHSLVEQNCVRVALEQLNADKAPQDWLSKDDPSVIEIAERMYDGVRKEMAPTTGLPESMTGPEGAALRRNYSAGLKEILNKAADKALRGHRSSSSTSSKAITFAGFGSMSSAALSTMHIEGRNPAYLLGANNSPLSSKSIYSDEYEEISLLGKGGYGRVYKARNYLDGQTYAIKKILITSQRLQKFRNKDQIQALLAELKTIAKLSHTNIVRYYHGWVEEEAPVPKPALPKKDEADEKRLLGGPETLPQTDEYGDYGSLSVDELQNTLQQGNMDMQLQFETGLDREEYADFDDNIVFGVSERHSTSRRVSNARRSSHASAASKKPSVRSAAEESESDIEVIPRTRDSNEGFTTSRVDRSKAVQVASETRYLGTNITLYIKMSLHPTTLQNYMSWDTTKPFDPATMQHCFHTKSAVGILTSLLDGLEYLHSQNIVHRDLKPANIFLSIDRSRKPSLQGCYDIKSCPECAFDDREAVYLTPCIGDFGLIAEIEQPVATPSSASSTPARFEPSPLAALQPKPVGTMFYRPRAMPKTDPVICPKLDVYSLGIIAFELIYKFGTRSERAIVLDDLKKGVLPKGYADHEVAGGVSHMVCEERDERWDCAAARAWLDGM